MIRAFRRLSARSAAVVALFLLAGLLFGLFSLFAADGRCPRWRKRTSLVDAARRREEAEALFRGLFDTSPVAIFLIEPEAKEILRTNPQAWKSYGFESFEDLVAHEFLDGPALFRKMKCGSGWTAPCGKDRNVLSGAIATKTAASFGRRSTLRPISVGERDLTLATCVDVTARKGSRNGLVIAQQ